MHVASATCSPAGARSATQAAPRRASQTVCAQHANVQGCVSHRQQAMRRRRRCAAAALEQEVTQGEEPSAAPSTSYGSESDDQSDGDSRDFALSMAKIAWETKCEDILVLHVEPVVYWCRYMLLCTVFSRPQLNAVLGKMTKEAEGAHGRRLSQNPQAGPGGWELLDYGDVVVHVMTAQQREYYDLENFYGAAQEVELPFDAADAASDLGTWSKKM